MSCCWAAISRSVCGESSPGPTPSDALIATNAMLMADAASAPQADITILIADGPSGAIVCPATVWRCVDDNPKLGKQQWQTFDVLKGMFLKQIALTRPLQPLQPLLRRSDFQCWVNNKPKLWSSLVHIDGDIMEGTIVFVWPAAKAANPSSLSPSSASETVAFEAVVDENNQPEPFVDENNQPEPVVDENNQTLPV
jgi:hypothetical protein